MNYAHICPKCNQRWGHEHCDPNSVSIDCPECDPAEDVRSVAMIVIREKYAWEYADPFTQWIRQVLKEHTV